MNYTNYSLAVFLLSDEARMVDVAYEPYDKNISVDQITPDTPASTQYSFKTFDKELKKGDYVIIPTSTRWGCTIGRIEEVDVDVDFNSTHEYKWLLGKINQHEVDEILAQEQQMISTIKAANKRKAKEELRESILANMQPEEVTALPLYVVEGEAKTEEKE